MAESMTVEQRVKHFLTLAEDKSATQEERDLAAAQAERLMIKHAIERATLEGLDTSKPSEKIVVQEYFVSGTYAYEVMLGHADVVRSLGLQSYYRDHRKGFYLPAAAKPGDRTNRGIMVCVVGFESDVRDAITLLRSLELQANVACAAWGKTFSSWMTPREKYVARREFQQSFGHGAARRIRDSRRTTIDETPGAALVLVDRSKKVSDYYETITTTVKYDRRQQTGSGMGAGYQAGYNANTGTSKSVSK